MLDPRSAKTAQEYQLSKPNAIPRFRVAISSVRSDGYDDRNPVSDLKTQKLDSQVMVKLPWYGDTVGQELGLLVSSSFGPPQKLSCPTQSSQ